MKKITVNNTELTLVPTEASDDIYLVKKGNTLLGWVGDEWEMFIHEFIDGLSVSPYGGYVFKSSLGTFKAHNQTLHGVLDIALHVAEKL